MPIVTGEITQDGAIISVLVGVSRSRHQRLLKVGLPVPESVAVRAIIDTGSYLTGLTPTVMQNLGVQPFANIPIRTPSTRPNAPHWCDQYDVSLTLVSGTTQKYLPSIHALASDDFDKDEGIQALIGRDVLGLCVFSYFGPHREFQLAF